jgi:hypothetical protein
MILATLRAAGRPLTACEMGFHGGFRHRVPERDRALGRLVRTGQVVAASQPNPRPNSPVKVFKLYRLARPAGRPA